MKSPESLISERQLKICKIMTTGEKLLATVISGLIAIPASYFTTKFLLNRYDKKLEEAIKKAHNKR